MWKCEECGHEIMRGITTFVFKAKNVVIRFSQGTIQAEFKRCGHINNRNIETSLTTTIK